MRTKETDWSYITVTHNGDSFTVIFHEDRGESWKRTYSWNSISKVCFKSYDYGAPHFCYLYFSDNPDEIILPVEEQDGVVEFWETLKAKGLFPSSKEKFAEYSAYPEFNCHDVK